MFCDEALDAVEAIAAGCDGIPVNYGCTAANTDTRSFGNTCEGRGGEEEPKAIDKRCNENGKEAF